MFLIDAPDGVLVIEEVDGWLDGLIQSNVIITVAAKSDAIWRQLGSNESNASTINIHATANAAVNDYESREAIIKNVT